MKNLNALVTGASSGIGLEFAKKLSRDGYAVTCVARNENMLREIVNKLGNNSRYIIADLTNNDDINKIIKDIERTKYSILINNAGFGIFERFTNIDINISCNIIQLNVIALIRLSYAFLIKAEAGDSIINVSSVLSLLPYPGGAIYSGTKAFVTNFSEALWYECKKKDIYIMSLLPGITDTNFHKIALGEKKNNNPKWLTYSPEMVVKEALHALHKRKSPMVISGPRYRWLTAICSKFFSRKRLVDMMGENSSGL